ncbi:hypothetical protein [Streptomyces fungicidicus]|uniref:hypothetical protein n=1 Tax=Streptomyces fungicidicus TaxID=68203 RepID=UPI00379F7342
MSSLFLLAPIFPPDGTSNAPSPLPRPGFPMSVSTKSGTWNGWGNEALCAGQREPAMEHVVWDAMQSDPVGSRWGRRVKG